MGGVLQSLLGLIVLPLLAWMLAPVGQRLSGREAIRIAALGVGLQFAIAALFLLMPALRIVFDLLAAGVAALQAATLEGMRFAFGYLAGAPAPYAVATPENGFILAIQALPLILIMSVLSKLLYHWGILQRVVGFFAWCLKRGMGVGGPLGTSVAANIFVGMVEAPLLVRPYLRDMSRSDLFAMMTAGMGSVAGTVMALYATIIEPKLPGAAGHIMVASIMSAPAAILIARLMLPDTAPTAEQPTADAPDAGARAGSAMDAIAQGTADGLKLVAYVTAMLVVMIALVALLNMALGAASEPVFGTRLTVEGLLGILASPFAWLIGVPAGEMLKGGELIGIKTALNEFVAYVRLGQMDAEALSERSRLILTYALCGFANFGSLGIMTGGLVAMCPERSQDFVLLGPRTIVSGTLATLMTGAVVGALTWS
ncbi:MAG: NupC/NupG family nucleoside CNT transporter [Parvibaculaceae bacterium]